MPAKSLPLAPALPSPESPPPWHPQAGDPLPAYVGACAMGRPAPPNGPNSRAAELAFVPHQAQDEAKPQPCPRARHSHLASIKDTESQSQLRLWACLSPPLALLCDHSPAGLAIHLPLCSGFVSFSAVHKHWPDSHSQDVQGRPWRRGSPRRGPGALLSLSVLRSCC